jgi:CheY-like chemotaxis protein
MRVLIADDESDILFTYRTALEVRGHSVTTVDNGEDCLKVYYDNLERRKVKRKGGNTNRDLSSSASQVGVVVLDYKMPRKNGLDVAKQILKWNPDQRIILTCIHSGNASRFCKTAKPSSRAYSETI